MRAGLLVATVALSLLSSGKLAGKVMPAPHSQPAPASQSTTAPTPASQPLTLYDVYRLTHTEQFDDLIVDAAQEWNLDPFLFRALLDEESGRGKRLINRTSGAAGIPQFVRRGIRGLNEIRCLRLYKRLKCDLGDDKFTRAKAFIPEEAIPASAELLSYLLSRWGWSGVAHYNGNTWKWGFAKRVYRKARLYRLQSGLPPMDRLRPRPSLLRPLVATS